MIVAINMTKHNPSYPWWRQQSNTTDSAIRCLSQNKKYKLLSLSLYVCFVWQACTNLPLFCLRYHCEPLSLFPSLSGRAKLSSKQAGQGWQHKQTITSCTRSLQWNHSHAYICYLIRSVCDLMFDFYSLGEPKIPLKEICKKVDMRIGHN